MMGIHSSQTSTPRRSITAWRLGAAILSSLWPAAWAAAQSPAPVPGVAPPAPPPPGIVALPPQEAPSLQPGERTSPVLLQQNVPVAPGLPPEEVRRFLQVSGDNDATIEIVAGQSRVLTLKDAIKTNSLIAVGDPSVVEFNPLNNRQIRLQGLKIGTTDLSISVPADVANQPAKTYNYNINVVADLTLLRARFAAIFPDASIKVTQIREFLVLEGQARDAQQVAQIILVTRAFASTIPLLTGAGGASQINSVGVQNDPNAAPAGGQGQPNAPGAPGQPGAPGAGVGPPGGLAGGMPGGAGLPGFGSADSNSLGALTAEYRVINLLRVPGSQQVLLKVRVAELNRTGFRQIGADILATDSRFGNIFGTRIGGGTSNAGSTVAGGILTGTAVASTSPVNTAFAIFPEANFQILFSALRRNNLLKILAEPNLVAMNGHQANFLAGGEFPITVPQVNGNGGTTVTVQYREFGVRLGFLPYVLDGDRIRLTVDPEVSSLDPTTSVTLVAGGSPIPGLLTRRAHTTVELKEGQTLAVAGLLQLTLDGSTQRIPILGDLPYIGPFFSNTTSQRQEKELVVLVTPYLVEPMNADQVPNVPGQEVKAPNDLEFYLLNRIEGRTGRDHRATTEYDDPFHLLRHMKMEKKYIQGPAGFSDF